MVSARAPLRKSRSVKLRLQSYFLLNSLLTYTRYIPLVAAIGLGFGAYNYYTQAQARHEFAILEEEKRLAKNRELMDAYGSKDSLEDVQQALEMYGR